MESNSHWASGSKVLVTGGTGSWGNELVSQLLKRDVKEVVVFSRGEFAQVTMGRKFDDERLRFVIGDVRDAAAVDEAFAGMDYVFHLAALKHVPICEAQPQEAIKTNVNGTANVISAAIKRRVKKVIDVSTDKAVEPINVYGMTKALGERMMIHANGAKDSVTSFVCVRGGNALGSNGRVVQYFIDTVRKDNRIYLTHPGMTRFFLTIPEAVALLFKATAVSVGGEVFVMNMPACKITNLAAVIAEEYGNESTKVDVTGIRPGEKLHEVLVSKHESRNAYVLGDSYFVILPSGTENAALDAQYETVYAANLEKFGINEFTSETKEMSNAEARELLTKGNF